MTATQGLGVPAGISAKLVRIGSGEGARSALGRNMCEGRQAEGGCGVRALGGAELGVDCAGEPGVAAGLGAVGFFECAEHEHEGCAGFDILAGGPAGVVEALGVAVDHGGGVGYGDVAVFGGGFEQDLADVDEGVPVGLCEGVPFEEEVGSGCVVFFDDEEGEVVFVEEYEGCGCRRGEGRGGGRGGRHDGDGAGIGCDDVGGVDPGLPAVVVDAPPVAEDVSAGDFEAVAGGGGGEDGVVGAGAGADVDFACGGGEGRAGCGRGKGGLGRRGGGRGGWGVAGFESGDFVGEESELGASGAGAAQGRDGAGEGGDAVGEAVEGDGGLGLQAGCAEREEEEDGGCEDKGLAFGGHGGVFVWGCGGEGGE